MQRIANYTSLLKVNGPLTLYFFAINYKLRVIFRMGYGLGRLIFITKISVVLGLGDGDLTLGKWFYNFIFHAESVF